MVQPSSLSLWVSSRSSVGSPATRRLPIKPSAGTSAFAGTWSTQLTGPALGSARFAARRCSGRGEPSDYDRNAATDPDGIPPSRAFGRGPAEVRPRSGRGAVRRLSRARDRSGRHRQPQGPLPRPTLCQAPARPRPARRLRGPSSAHPRDWFQSVFICL